ncbi:MAG TPA: hypothetical protein DCS28_02670 [Candidatus Moranbacteria bacterium]|nr:hypothetical protein [Candidatus Moranbacteria bacterium]HAT74919.1 hypothetical protein [Candidatus Moranbacteria bacterium]
MRNDTDERKNSWLIRMIIFLGFTVAVFIVLAISKETYRKKQVQKEINELQSEAEKIQGDNLRLADKIAYLEGQDYQEKEIRDKLNLQKPDETVVIIKPSLTKKTAEDKPEAINQALIIKTSNPQKWWDYFFKY